MAYEVKLIMAEKNNTNYFLEIARVDLSKIGNGYLHKIIAFSQGKIELPEFMKTKEFKKVQAGHLELPGDTSDLFGIGLDYTDAEVWEGKTKMTEDMYGVPLHGIPINQILYVINLEIDSDKYRRFDLAKVMLEEFSTNKWQNMYVIPFPH